MRILFCDNDPEERADYHKRLTTVWSKLCEDGALMEGLEMEVCADISETVNIPDGRKIKELGGFDGFLLDIFWDDEREKNPHGIDLAEQLRAEYPEKPILMFTASAKAEGFHRLINVDICGYLRKGDEYEYLCLQIFESINGTRKAKNGQCLYKHIRELTSSGNGWKASFVGQAASQVWELERSYDRWIAFWDAFAQPIADKSLSATFRGMSEFFKESDLMTLGVMPGMRGHLDHVLNVYFTGYVISNKNARFRDAAIGVAKKFFPDKAQEIDQNEEHYWDLFQLAWLTAATLHDTAYALEVLPDIYARCGEVADHFRPLLSSDFNRKELAPISLSDARVDELSELVRKLDSNLKFDFIKEGREFPKDETSRANHGVAGALLLLELISEDHSEELQEYLRWAAAAMALHSLKIPGSKKGYSISLDKDPLSYLLMVCDEVQVWGRERPDANRMDSFIKDIQLVGFEVSGNEISADVDHVPYEGTGIIERIKELRGEIDDSIINDRQVLGKYISWGGVSVLVRQRVANSDIVFPELKF